MGWHPRPCGPRFRLSLLVAFTALPVLQAEPKGALPVMTADAIVIANDVCRYEMGTDGLNRAFVDLAEQKNYCEPGQPVMVVRARGKLFSSTRVELSGETLRVSFGDSGVQVAAILASRPGYFTLTVVEVSGAEVEWVQFCNLRLTLSQSVGTLVNAAWDEHFAACVLAGNDRTHSYGADEARGNLQAKCYREFGFEGAKIAIIGVPTGAPDPANRLLDAIERVEIEQGLPHPMLNGVWIKRAPERFASYLMVNGISEQNIDQVVAFAKGGFGCVEIYPWRSTPGYELNPQQFPHGMAGLKAVADKVHAAGLQLGLHCMQAMVGWGPKNDPYIVPKADPRLLQDRHATLAAALEPTATTLTVKEGTTGWPERGDLYLDGEIVQYLKRTDTGFAECQRGLHGTTIAAHPVGATVGRLVNCFPIWGHTVYCPDIKTDMIEEVCDRLASVFNETGADMSYFDGGEEVNVQPPQWRNQGRVALGVHSRLKQPVILEGNALYTNLSWHVITRGSPHFDPIYFGRRIYTLRHKGQNPARWAQNLLTGDVGWFHPHTHSLTTDAVTPDEVLLLCLKALGGNAPISFSMNAANPWENRRMPEMLEIIRACDELKRRGAFSEAVRAELVKPMAEHTLECAADGEWQVRPLQFGPPRLVAADSNERREWRSQNVYAEQSPWIRIRAQTQLAPYGSKENLVLADFGGAVPFKPVDAASPNLVQTVEPSPETAPDGASVFCYRAENRGKAASGWCRISYPLPKALDLSTHRRLGLWLRSEGQGGILNVQLAATDARRDHYVPLSASGWTYVVLDAPEDSRYYDYTWPYGFTDLMYTCWPVYTPTKELNLYFNALPAGAKTACWISRIEALQETSLPLRSPALEAGGQRLVFPVTLKPNEYVELDWRGQGRHFDADGGLLAEVAPEGALRLPVGESTVRFACTLEAAASARAEVTLATRGEPLPNPTGERKPARRRAAADRLAYPSLAAVPSAVGDELKLLADGRGGWRLFQGSYLRLADDPVQSVSAFDGKANVWTVASAADTACRAGIVLTYAAGTQDYDHPQALVVESFADLTSYRGSATNAFEKYVVGEGKQFHAGGPVRAGVTQSFAATTAAAKVGPSCAVYSATNAAGAGGWCALGKRFAPGLDLSRFTRLALWVCGDNKGETLKIQFWDTAGKYADWLVPVNYSGWRLQSFDTATATGFDWARIDYLIIYYNGLPADTTCEIRLDGLKALPAAGKALALEHAALTLNGRRLALPDLAPGAAVTVDGVGRIGLWHPGKEQATASKAKGGGLILQPGVNQLELSGDSQRGGPPEVTLRVLRFGPVRQ